VIAYGCARHRDRGSAVCAVTVYQSKAEVEAALIDQLQTYVLGEQALGMVIGQVRAEIEAQIPQPQNDIAALEAELASVRAEQKRLAKAVALSDEVPELVVELTQRLARIQNLEAQLIAAKRTPASWPRSLTAWKRTSEPAPPSFAKRSQTTLIVARCSRRCSPTA
jgi:hypothetical protein